MKLPSHLKDPSSEELSLPLMSNFLHFIAELQEEISRLKAEIRLLKGHSAPPTIPPKSQLERKEAQEGELRSYVTIQLPI
ncbi:MAG: hypothetical protein AAF600_09015 [Bacteroidota bacterium]